MKIDWKKLLISLGPVFGLVLVFILFTILAPAEFHSLYNLKTIVTQTVIVGIGALGMTMVIISGGIDLSVGSQIALCTVVTAAVLNAFAGASADYVAWLPAMVAAAAGITACGVCGAVNGIISVGGKIVPFIVTLGMMQIARGVAKWIAGQQTVMTPDNFLWRLMSVDPEPSWLIFAPGVWVLIALLVLLAVALKFTVFGRHVFAIGSNEATARLCGVNVRFKRIMIYTFCGLFTGVAGVMQYANLTVGDPTAAGGMELDIIAAVVIGGGSLNGGEGSALGSLIGALIMAVLHSGCSMLGVPNYVQEIMIGSIIVIAAGLDNLKHRFIKSA